MTFEKRTVRGRLGHPEKYMIPISRFAKDHSIVTVEDLIQYFKLTLPRNKKGELKMPQVNMRHPVKEKCASEQNQEPPETCNCNPERTQSLIMVLEVQVAELTDRNTELVQEMDALKARLQVVLC